MLFNTNKELGKIVKCHNSGNYAKATKLGLDPAEDLMGEIVKRLRKLYDEKVIQRYEVSDALIKMGYAGEDLQKYLAEITGNTETKGTSKGKVDTKGKADTDTKADVDIDADDLIKIGEHVSKLKDIYDHRGNDVLHLMQQMFNSPDCCSNATGEYRVIRKHVDALVEWADEVGWKAVRKALEKEFGEKETNALLSAESEAAPKAAPPKEEKPATLKKKAAPAPQPQSYEKELKLQFVELLRLVNTGVITSERLGALFNYGPAVAKKGEEEVVQITKKIHKIFIDSGMSNTEFVQYANSVIPGFFCEDDSDSTSTSKEPASEAAADTEDSKLVERVQKLESQLAELSAGIPSVISDTLREELKKITPSLSSAEPAPTKYYWVCRKEPKYFQDEQSAQEYVARLVSVTGADIKFDDIIEVVEITEQEFKNRYDGYCSDSNNDNKPASSSKKKKKSKK